MKRSELLKIIESKREGREILKALADAGFKVTDKTKESDSLLHVFAESKHARKYYNDDLLEAFLKAGADIGTVDSDGNLFYMRLPENVDGFKAASLISVALKKTNFNIKHRNKKNQSVFETVFKVTSNSSSCIKTILNHSDFDPNQLDSQGESPLTFIIKTDPVYREDYTKMLLKHEKFDPGFLNKAGESCLELVFKKTPCYWGDDAKIIINHQKFDPTFKDKEGRSYLYLLMDKKKYGWESVANLLIEKGVDPEELPSHLARPFLEKKVREEFYNRFSFPSSLDDFSDEFIELELKFLSLKNLCNIKDDTTMLAHLFSLKGEVPYIRSGISSTITLTGSNDSETSVFIAYLYHEFVKHIAQENKHKEHYETLVLIRNLLIKSMRYYFLQGRWTYPGEINKKDVLEMMLKDIEKTGLPIITGWFSHSISVFIRELNLDRCNGGGCSYDATIEQYWIAQKKNLDVAFLDKLQGKATKIYIQGDMHSHLGLEFKGKVKGQFQTVGNCSLESKLISVHAMKRSYFYEKIADALYQEALTFMRQFYLPEYMRKYGDTKTACYLMIRLIAKSTKEEAINIVKTYFKEDVWFEKLHIDMMLRRRRLLRAEKKEAVEELDQIAKGVGLDLMSYDSDVQRVFFDFINDCVTEETWNVIGKVSSALIIDNVTTLLHIAVENDNVNLARELLEKNAKLLAEKNSSGLTPIYTVQSPEMVDLLCEFKVNVNPDAKDSTLNRPIKRGNILVLKALLKAGAKPDENTGYYAGNQSLEIVRELKEYCPEVLNRKTHSGKTLFLNAATRCDGQKLRDLVKEGVSPSLSTVNGRTPLLELLKKGDKETAEYLMDCPSSMLTKMYRGEKPEDHVDDVKLTQKIRRMRVQKEADLNYFQKVFRVRECFKLIKKAESFLISAIEENDMKAVRGCVLAFPELMVTGFNEEVSASTAIHAAVLKDNVEMVQLLLKMPGIDINAKNGMEERPIHMATSINSVQMLEILFEQG